LQPAEVPLRLADGRHHVDWRLTDGGMTAGQSLLILPERISPISGGRRVPVHLLERLWMPDQVRHDDKNILRTQKPSN
jgi:hypothetical protein